LAKLNGKTSYIPARLFGRALLDDITKTKQAADKQATGALNIFEETKAAIAELLMKY